MKSSLIVKNLQVDLGEWKGNWSFSVPDTARWVSIIGKSGSGKSTLLKALAGLLSCSADRLVAGQKDLMDLACHKRQIGYMAQQSSLFPFLNVQENLLLAMHDLPMTKRQKLIRITQTLDSLSLGEDFLPRPIQAVSGGQLARLNLARALLRPCQILLLDEPFAALDEKLRTDLHLYLQRWQKEHKILILCVTHHQDDALEFADRLLFLDPKQPVLSFEVEKLYSHCQSSVHLAEFIKRALVCQENELNPETSSNRQLILTPEWVHWEEARTSQYTTPEPLVFNPEKIGFSGGMTLLHGVLPGKILYLEGRWDGRQPIYFDSSKAVHQP